MIVPLCLFLSLSLSLSLPLNVSLSLSLSVCKRLRSSLHFSWNEDLWKISPTLEFQVVSLIQKASSCPKLQCKTWLGQDQLFCQSKSWSSHKIPLVWLCSRPQPPHPESRQPRCPPPSRTLLCSTTLMPDLTHMRHMSMRAHRGRHNYKKQLK